MFKKIYTFYGLRQWFLKKTTTKKHCVILIVKPGYMGSGSFPKSLSPAKGCGAALYALVEGPAERQDYLPVTARYRLSTSTKC